MPTLIEALSSEIADTLPVDIDFDTNHTPKQPTKTISLELPFNVIAHPFADEFAEEDLQQITIVRSLGRALIDSAKLSLLAAIPDLSEKSPEDKILEAYNDLKVYWWYDAHSELNYDHNLEQDQDAANPSRLANWPNGEYVNCLGVSIASVAIAELSGVKHLYINEIKNAQQLVSNFHSGVMSLREKLFAGDAEEPQFKDFFTAINLIFKILKSEEELDPDVDLLMLNIPPTLKREDQIRDFHHSALLKFPGEDYWFQFDPYSLVLTSCKNDEEEIDSVHEAVKDSQGEVFIFDSVSDISEIFRVATDKLKEAKRQQVKIKKFFEKNNYKSEYFLRDVRRMIVDTIRAIEIMDAEVPNSEEAQEESEKDEVDDQEFAGALTSYAITNLVLDQVEPGAAHLESFIEAFKKAVASNDNIEEYYDFVIGQEKELFARMQVDSNTRAAFEEFVSLFPMVIWTSIYQQMLLKQVYLKTAGLPDAVAEYMDPEIGIGAMVLNHYATYRNDGRVNIAKELVEILPSQLLWQASLQDGSEQTERARAVQEQINALPSRQLHPRVALANAMIQPTKI